VTQGKVDGGGDGSTRSLLSRRCRPKRAAAALLVATAIGGVVVGIFVMVDSDCDVLEFSKKSKDSWCMEFEVEESGAFSV